MSPSKSRGNGNCVPLNIKILGNLLGPMISPGILSGLRIFLFFTKLTLIIHPYSSLLGVGLWQEFSIGKQFHQKSQRVSESSLEWSQSHESESER